MSGRLTAQESRLRSHSSNTVFESLCVVKKKRKEGGEITSHGVSTAPRVSQDREQENCEFKTDKVRRRRLDVIIKTHSDLYPFFRFKAAPGQRIRQEIAPGHQPEVM